MEVVPGPSETAFRMTKAVILLPKHMVENQTGMQIEIKQLGTSDPALNSMDVQHRCARLLGANERCESFLQAGCNIYWITIKQGAHILGRRIAPQGAGHASSGVRRYPRVAMERRV